MQRQVSLITVLRKQKHFQCRKHQKMRSSKKMRKDILKLFSPVPLRFQVGILLVGRFLDTVILDYLDLMVQIQLNQK